MNWMICYYIIIFIYDREWIEWLFSGFFKYLFLIIIIYYWYQYRHLLLDFLTIYLSSLFIIILWIEWLDYYIYFLVIITIIFIIDSWLITSK